MRGFLLRGRDSIWPNTPNPSIIDGTPQQFRNSMHLLIFLLAITLHGRVLDSKTGEPIAKATVAIRDQALETRTNDNGEFELTEVPAGEIELQVTTVGYGLVRRKLEIGDAPIEL